MYNKRRRKKYLIFLVGCVLLLLTGCSSKSAKIEALKESGVIKIGVHKNSAYTRESNYLSSIEQDLIKQICTKLEIDAEFYFYDMHELEEFLTDGEVDVAIGNLVIEDWYRNKSVVLSEPYDNCFLYLVTRRGDYSSNIKALSERNAGVLEQVSEGSKQQLYQADNVTLVMYSSSEKAADDLKSNVISAFVCYQEQAEIFASDEQFQVQDLRGVSQEEFTILTKVGREDLLAVINEVIQELE